MEEQIINDEILRAYEHQKLRKRLFLILMLIGMVVLVFIAVTIGPIEMAIGDAYKIIASHLFPSWLSPTESVLDGIVWKVRFPRVLTGLCVGFGLAISSAVMQPVLRNPMATPYTLGISSAAGFGAALAIGLGEGLGVGTMSIMASAFLCSLFVVAVIAAVSKWKRATPEVIILTGIALSYFFNAGIRLLQYVVDPIYTKEMVFWLAGSLYKGNWENLTYIFFAVLVFSIYLIYKSKELNAISAGDEVAKSIGVNVDQTRGILMIVGSVLTAILVSFTGTIGFIGLVAPHITRMILKGDNNFVVVGSGLVGAFLLVLSDMVAMNIMAPTVLPIGVITAFMGVPLFLYLIFKMKGGKC
jgi:iron complex transport system permease protein